jgi:hypothetical protein
MNVALFAALTAALLQAEPVPPAKKYPIKIEAVAEKPVEGAQRIRVKVIIQDGYHLIANPSGNEDLPTRTKMSVTDKDAKITYPVGQVVKDENVGDYRIYQGTVTFEAVVKRAAGDGPLEVAVRVRPFDDRGCLWGERTLKASVP